MNSTYDLTEIKALIRSNCRFITTQAINDARKNFDFREEDIIATVLTLTEADLYKTMPSEKKPDLWQDVYHKDVSVEGITIKAYIKLQIQQNKQGKLSVIISFKKK